MLDPYLSINFNKGYWEGDEGFKYFKESKYLKIILKILNCPWYQLFKFLLFNYFLCQDMWVFVAVTKPLFYSFSTSRLQILQDRNHLEVNQLPLHYRPPYHSAPLHHRHRPLTVLLLHQFQTSVLLSHKQVGFHKLVICKQRKL